MDEKLIDGEYLVKSKYPMLGWVVDVYKDGCFDWLEATPDDCEWVARAAKAEADNERLRGALETCLEQNGSGACSRDVGIDCLCWKCIALKALAGDE